MPFMMLLLVLLIQGSSYVFTMGVLCRFQVLQKAYPFLCTSSVKNNATKR